MKFLIYKSTKYILGILINIFNVFAKKKKLSEVGSSSFPSYFNTIIKPKELILSKEKQNFQRPDQKSSNPMTLRTKIIPWSSLAWGHSEVIALDYAKLGQVCK